MILCKCKWAQSQATPHLCPTHGKSPFLHLLHKNVAACFWKRLSAYCTYIRTYVAWYSTGNWQRRHAHSIHTRVYRKWYCTKHTVPNTVLKIRFFLFPARVCSFPRLLSNWVLKHIASYRRAPSHPCSLSPLFSSFQTNSLHMFSTEMAICMVYSTVYVQSKKEALCPFWKFMTPTALYYKLRYGFFLFLPAVCHFE